MSAPHEPAPTTGVVTTGWRSRVDLRPRLFRLRDSSAAIVQIVVAATGAYTFAQLVLGHSLPLVAATVTVSSLGLVRDARPRRVIETVAGMLVGILIAEVIVVVAGGGWWQLALALGTTLIIARFLSAQPAFAIAAAIQALIALSVGVGAPPFLRLVDGIVGGIAALLVTALVPRSGRRTELRDAAALFDAVENTVATLAQALRRGDRLRAERGLEKARALQAPVDQWRTSLESSIAIARISPFLHRERSELARHERVRQSMDLATRNLRVVARRTVYLVDDGQPRQIAADLLGELGRTARLVADALDDLSLEPAARAAIIGIAARLDPAALLPDATLSDQNLLTALRPLAVDLLTATGMPSAEARAIIPRI